MAIQITSKLTSTQRQRISRHCAATADAMYDTGYPYPRDTHIGRNTYDRVGRAGDVSPHDLARRLMVAAGRTFEYVVVSV